MNDKYMETKENKPFEKYLEKQLRRIRKKYLKVALDKEDYYLTMTIMTAGKKGKDGWQKVIMANNRTYREDKNNQVNITIFE